MKTRIGRSLNERFQNTTAPNTTAPNTTAAKQYFYALAVVMRDGHSELRRFHLPLDVRAYATEAEHNGFVVWCLNAFGIRPQDTANGGDVPNVVLQVYETEAECEVAYAEMVEIFEAKPGSALLGGTAPGGEA